MSARFPICTDYSRCPKEYIFRWYLSYYDLWGPFTVASAGMRGNILIFSAPLGTEKIKFHLANGKIIIAKIERLPKLEGVQPEERAKWDIRDSGKKIVFVSSRLASNLELTVEEVLSLEKDRRRLRSKSELTSPSSGQAS